MSCRNGGCLKAGIVDVLRLLSRELAEPELAVSVQVVEEPMVVEGDPDQWKQVFINVVENAHEAH
jgi:signal transduction histidine kinase